MDQGAIFVLGVAFGLLGGIGFILLLIGSDDYATAYFSAYWRRLGAPGAAINPEAQETAVNSKEQAYKENLGNSGERPGGSGSSPGLLALALAVLLTGCAHGGAGGHVSALAPLPAAAAVPVCGFEAPYLPDPCKVQVAPGEWLVVSESRTPNPQVKKHSRWWWLLMALVTI